MSQRVSGYERQANEQYMTPEWVAETLCRVIYFRGPVWEPACGEGAITRVINLKFMGMAETISTDIDPIFGVPVVDFLSPETQATFMPAEGSSTIVTNPPYGKGGKLAEKFVRTAVQITQPKSGKVAMLLPVDWDCAKGRRDLFEDFPGHVTKITLTERIRWTNLPQSKSGPSQNHAWFIWDHSRKGRDMRWLGRVSA